MKKSKSFFWLRLASTIIDTAAIYCLATLFTIGIGQIIFAAFTYLFIAVWIVYYVLSYRLLGGQTPAKMLTGIRVVYKNGSQNRIIPLLLREIIGKAGLGIVVPGFLIEHFFPVWSALHSLFAFTCMILLSALVLLIFKKNWWEFLSNTATIKASQVPKQSIHKSFAFLSVLTIIFLITAAYPFLSGKKQIETSQPAAYPAGKETVRYADFIKQHAQDPVEYIFKLFEKYDIVVISERMHPEYTQYELIYKIVGDKRFAQRAGNIFTECGSVSFQDTLDTYLKTIYPTEDLLNKRTADLQRSSNAIWPLWDNTNLFDFFKMVNRLNSKLADSTKIHWYFTDLSVNWEMMTHEKFQAAYRNPDRDSIMATHIIEKYRKSLSGQQRKKALVIMNTRHGYGSLKNKFPSKIRLRDDNATAYLMDALPGKVANVMMNTVSIRYGFILTPVQHGKWETAFASLGNPEAAFDFAGSPFGNDIFDLSFFNAPNLTYKDVFTGFIFYKPLSQHFEKTGFPYEYEGYEDSIIRRTGCVSQSFAEARRAAITEHKLHPEENTIQRPLNYSIYYNLVNAFAIPAVVFIIYLVSLVFCIRRIRMMNRN